MHSLIDREPESKRRWRGVCQEALSVSAPKEHILIVDDEKWIVQIVREMFEKLGYQVTGHTSSKEALEAVRQQPKRFDLVITDFIMPEMSGVELAQELTFLRLGIPIILYTAIGQAISPENAKKIGIEDYLMKPVTAVELQQAVRRVLDARLPEGASNRR